MRIFKVCFKQNRYGKRHKVLYIKRKNQQKSGNLSMDDEALCTRWSGLWEISEDVPGTGMSCRVVHPSNS